MLSSADKVAGQGVGSAYLELVKLLKEKGKDTFDIQINKGIKDSDIIHCHTVDLGNYFKMKKAKVPTIAYVHFLPDTLDGSIKLPKFAFNIFKKYVIKFYKTADHLVVVNPIFKKDMIKAGLDEDKIEYIPNFVSKEEFYKKDDIDKRKIRKEFKLNDKDFIVLGAGQVQTRKGVLDFVEVAKKLPDITFVWAGGFSFGSITDGYEELKKVMDNPPKNVKFLGIIPREKMNDLFNAADLLFVPSYNELFPMTILEACSTNTPLLLRDLELYEDILFKKYIKGSNNDEFVKAITKYKEDKKLYKEQVENSKYISNYYSEDNIYKIWEKFYKSLLKEND